MIAMHEFLFVLVLAGLAFGAFLAFRAALGLFSFMARGFVLLLIVAMAVIPFVI